eukprot:243122-Chlamydomonas_euryale.AAC.2
MPWPRFMHQDPGAIGAHTCHDRRSSKVMAKAQACRPSGFSIPRRPSLACRVVAATLWLQLPIWGVLHPPFASVPLPWSAALSLQTCGRAARLSALSLHAVVKST